MSTSAGYGSRWPDRPWGGNSMSGVRFLPQSNCRCNTTVSSYSPNPSLGLLWYGTGIAVGVSVTASGSTLKVVSQLGTHIMPRWGTMATSDGLRPLGTHQRQGPFRSSPRDRVSFRLTAGSAPLKPSHAVPWTNSGEEGLLGLTSRLWESLGLLHREGRGGRHLGTARGPHICHLQKVV